MATRRGALEEFRARSDEDLVEWLRTRPEDQWFDRASARTTPRQLADLMVGFGNAEGGAIVLGIHGGMVEGTAAAADRNNDWRQAARDFTDPPVRHRVATVPCVNAEGEADRLVLIEVQASEPVHANVRGEVFLRVGDENRRLGPLEAQELRYDKGESIFDGRPAHGAGFGDLDDRQIERFLRRVGATGDPTPVLQARGLVTTDGGVRPTMAGLLVLGRKPQAIFPEASVRLLRYAGTSRETGARANIVADRRLDGPLPAQVDRARTFLRRWLPTAIRLGRAGKFAPTPVFPEFAWLEAIVNAVMHRSYSLAGDHVRVEVFEDRIEVESPGRLPGLVRPETIRSTRFARNPRIARAMNDLGYGRELGEGVDRMFEEMARAGLPDPVFRQGPASVRVALLADPLPRRILELLPSGSELLADHLARRGRVTTSEAVQLLDASRPTVLKYLHELVRAGLIEHVGTSLKDPRGYWRVAGRRE